MSLDQLCGYFEEQAAVSHTNLNANWAFEYAEYLNNLAAIYGRPIMSVPAHRIEQVYDFTQKHCPKDKLGRKPLYKYVKFPVKITRNNFTREHFLTVTASKFEEIAKGKMSEEEFDMDSHSDIVRKMRSAIGVTFLETKFTSVEDAYRLVSYYAPRGRFTHKLPKYTEWYASEDTATLVAYRLERAIDINDFNLSAEGYLPLIYKWYPYEQDIIATPQTLNYFLEKYDDAYLRNALFGTEGLIEDIKSAASSLRQAFSKRGQYLYLIKRTTLNGYFTPLEAHKPDKGKAKANREALAVKTSKLLDDYVK